jgi:hypothetical protein
MRNRLLLGALVSVSLMIPLTGCTRPSGLDSISISPATQSVTAGQTVQFSAVGTFGNSSRPTTQTLASGVSWTSSNPSVATIDPSSGRATTLLAGTTTITASASGFNGPVTANTTLTATASTTTGGSPVAEPILSLTIVPSSLTVGNIGDTGQFLAIATYATAPYVRDVTNSPSTTWISSFPNDFPVGTNSGGNSGASAGLVTAYANGSGTIIAESTSPDGTIQDATAQFNCPLALPNPNGDPPTPGTCYSGAFGPLLATITVYAQGLNTTNWLITAPSATGTPDVIHCGPGWAADGNTGGSVCTATYPLNTTVTLTAPAQAGVAFGGWSNYCIPAVAVTAAGPNSCTITLTPPAGSDGSYNVTVSAVFN